MTGIVRKWAVISAVWFFALTIVTFVCVFDTKTNAFSVSNSYAHSDDYVYITDNGASEGILYQMQGKKITSYFHTNKLAYLKGYRALLTTVYEENPYVLFALSRDDNGRDVTEYSVCSFNTDLGPTAITAPFHLALPVEVSGFSVSDDRIYLTGIAENRRTVYVYSISTSQLNEITTTALSSEDVEKWKKNTVDVKEVLSEGSEGVRYYGQVKYEEGTFLTRMDNELAGDFSLDTSVSEAFSARKIPLSLRLSYSGVSVSFILMIFAIGVGVIFILCIVLNKKKRVVYQVAITEGILFAGLTALYVLYVFNGKSGSENSFAQWASQSMLSVFDGYELSDLSDSSIYSTADYRVIANRLLRVQSTDFNRQYLVQTADIVASDDTVLLSADGCNFDTLSEKYTKTATSLMTNCISTSTLQTKTGYYNGEKALYVAVPLSKSGLNGYGALVIAVLNPDEIYHTPANSVMLLMLALLFVAASGIFIFLLIEQSKDLGYLQEALGSLSRGETDIQKPLVIGSDMNYIWNSVFEIQKNIQNINREKLLTYEAYYKFAPKGVERILGLSSATEITGRENIQRMGTVMTLSISGRDDIREQDMDSLMNLYSDLEACREKYNAIFVSHTNNFDTVKYLFLEENSRAVEFGADYIRMIRERQGQLYRNAAILLYYTPFVYGVVGIKDQACIYMTSPNSKLMDALSVWLNDMHIAVAITQDVKDRTKPGVSIRYIGFVIPKNKTKEDAIGLYEVLDALPSGLRLAKEDTKEDFDKAMQLFKERDFYLARNIFSEILRKVPEDEIAKWYLFECEKYLDEAVPEDYTGAIHME